MAYELVLHAVERARSADRKSVVVVSGGPGSGKSVIALSVLGELARQNRSVMHATGSRSFTQTLRRYAGKGSTRLKNLFGYFNSFMSAERNGLDVLICDEAHRIRETSVNRFTPKARRDGARPQIDELIAAARVPVFLLDEHQVVKPGELGNVEVISSYAKQLDLDVEVVSLHGQFRCGGSEAYEEWVVDLLGLDGGEPSVWAGDGTVRPAARGVAGGDGGLPRQRSRQPGDGQNVGRVLLAVERSASGRHRWCRTCRSAAGSRPWNVKSDRSVGDAPGSAFWATDPNGFGQVGCVYTAQGFEYDWSGVIIGPDLVARDGRLVTRRDGVEGSRVPQSQDGQRRRGGPLIRNTYKVLLTRGMQGTIVYSTDPETREYLASMVKVIRPVETVYETAPGDDPRLTTGLSSAARCVRRTLATLPPTRQGTSGRAGQRDGSGGLW